MAVVFELVLNCGDDEAAVGEAERAVTGRSVTIRGAELPLQGPFITRFKDRYVEFSIVVPAIGAGGPTCPTPFDVRTLTDDEVSALGVQLYDLLRELRTYEAAAVGWDPEERVNLDELAADLADGYPLPAGVVLANDAADVLGVAGSTELFDTGHVWVPYQGDRSLWNRAP